MDTPDPVGEAADIGHAVEQRSRHAVTLRQIKIV
jgi:hypothetical protein